MSLIHWLTDSCSHKLIGSLKFTDLLVQWFTDSLRRGTTDSLIQWFVGSLFHWFITLLSHCFIGSLSLWLADLLIGWCVDPLPFAHSLMHLTTLTVHGFCSANNFPAGHWFISYRNFNCSKLPPTRGPCTVWFTYMISQYIPSGSGITPEFKYSKTKTEWAPVMRSPKESAIVCPNLSFFSFGIIMINLEFGNAQVITAFQRNPSPSSVGACWFICV